MIYDIKIIGDPHHYIPYFKYQEIRFGVDGPIITKTL